MPSLLEDIQAERLKTKVEVRSLAKILLTEMCGSINDHKATRPVVAALVGDNTELFFPKWHTSTQKDSIFASISQGLQDRSASAAVCAFPGTVGNSGQAVIIIVQTLDWKELMIMPYRIIEDEVKWMKPQITTDFDSPLIDISCAN